MENEASEESIMEKLIKVLMKHRFPAHELCAILAVLSIKINILMPLIIVFSFLIYEIVEAKEIRNKSIDQAHKDIRGFLVWFVGTIGVILILQFAGVVR